MTRRRTASRTVTRRPPLLAVTVSAAAIWLAALQEVQEVLVMLVMLVMLALLGLALTLAQANSHWLLAPRPGASLRGS
jgi:hypothetical protein